MVGDCGGGVGNMRQCSQLAGRLQVYEYEYVHGWVEELRSPQKLQGTHCYIFALQHYTYFSNSIYLTYYLTL